MPELWQQLVTEWPVLTVILDALCIIVPFACLTAYSGIFYLSSTAAILAVTRKRASYRKCARQLAFLGLIIGWALLIGTRVWLYYTAPAREAGSFEAYMLEISWLLFSIGTLLSSIYFFLWNALKNMPVLHVTLGMIAAVQNCIAFVCIVFTVRISAAISLPDAKKFALPDIFPNAWYAPVWTSTAYAVPLLFSMAGAFGVCWLALRRNKDNFGRDHYNAMIPWCAAWAQNAWAILLFLLICSTSLKIWREIQNGNFDEQGAIYDASLLLLWIIPEILWLLARKSRMPLRNRWLLYLALPFAITFILPWFMDITLI